MQISDSPRFRNVFVLCTGRCGSVAFAQACSHFTNYSSAHESRSKIFGPDHLNYPEFHIEVDNRLSWFLGRLEREFGDDAFYVHLTRDPQKVAKSFDARWDNERSLMRAFNFGLRMLGTRTDHVADDLVATINENIEAFLANKTHKMRVEIENSKPDFQEFAELIGAVGALEAALAEFDHQHNSTPVADAKGTAGRDDRFPTSFELKTERQKTKTDAVFLSGRLRELEARHAQTVRLLEKTKRSHRKFRKVATVLALPSLVVLSPIILPLAAVRYLKRHRNRAAKARTLQAGL